MQLLISFNLIRLLRIIEIITINHWIFSFIRIIISIQALIIKQYILILNHMNTIQQANKLILNSLHNISQIENNIITINKIFTKSRSLSCLDKNNGLSSIISPKMHNPSLSFFNSPTNLLKKKKSKGSDSIYLKQSKKILNLIPNIFKKKNNNCKLHSHENCEACKLKESTTDFVINKNNKHHLMKSKKVFGKQKKRNSSMNKIYVVQKIDLTAIDRQKEKASLKQFKKMLEDKLERVNKEIQNKKHKLIKKSIYDSSFCLNTLKTSIKTQFSSLKENTESTCFIKKKSNPIKCQEFSFEGPLRVGPPNFRYNKIFE